MSGRMQENSGIAVRLVPEETRAMTTPVLWRAEASIRMERMASALVTASKEADHFFREVSYCSHYPRFDTERDVPDVETNNWRAVCGKTASTVRREGRRKPSLPLSTARIGFAPNSLLIPCSAKKFPALAKKFPALSA
jgi:hypothetical protein